MQSISIGDALFTKTQQKVLGLLFGWPDRSFYTNEIMRLVGMGRGTVSRELARLVSAGLLVVSKEGNQNHYQANSNSPVYSELVSMVKKISANTDEQKNVTMVKDKDSIVIGNKIVIPRKALEKLVQQYGIKHLALFGSAARGQLKPDSDIDLLVEFEKEKAPSLGGMVKLQDAFSALFGGRKVDIATPTILNNPYRRRAIEKDMEELYAA